MCVQRSTRCAHKSKRVRFASFLFQEAISLPGAPLPDVLLQREQPVSVGSALGKAMANTTMVYVRNQKVRVGVLPGLFVSTF